ncbi:MAG: BsuPI-related putative proteinase inhibitor [Firmicutes bacterium]|nr:BsuPI-related putative proteinase inhibitor [Bacillota bacterium]
MAGKWMRTVLAATTAAAVVAGATLLPAPALAWGQNWLPAMAWSRLGWLWNWGHIKPVAQAKESLQYRLEQVNRTRLRFTVTNAGKTPVPLVFQGHTHEVVIRDGKGKEVWRLTEETAAVAAIRQLQLKPGAILSYDVELPELKPGRYTVEAYLLTVNAGRTAGRATLTLEIPEQKPAAQLATSVAVVAPEPGAAPMLAVTVRNQGKQAAKLEAEGGVLGEVVLSGGGRSRFWSGTIALPDRKMGEVQWAPGESRTWFVPLPELKQGTTYTAEVILRDLGKQPVARKAFVAGTAPAGLRYTLTLSGKDRRQVRLQVTNPGNKPVDLTFPSGQQFDLVLWQADGKEAWRWAKDKASTAVVQTRRLQPGASLTFDAELPRDLDLARAGLTLAAYVTATEVGEDPVAAVAVREPQAAALAFEFEAQASADGGRLNLTVRNTGKEAVTLRFPSGAQHDFVLKDEKGQEVWRWSKGLAFVQPVQDLRLNAGASLRYSAELPADLPAGTYTAEAWFLAEGYSGKPVARERVTVAPKKASLRFTLTVDRDRNPGRAKLTVANPGKEPVTIRFSSSRQYDFVLRDEKGKEVWRWSQDRLFAQPVTDARLNAGAVLTYESDLPQNLPAGTYTLEAWFLAEGYNGGPVARERVTFTGRATLGDLRFQVEPVYEGKRLTAFRVRVTNTARAALDLEFPTMQHLELRLRDSRGRVVWTWSDGEVILVAPNSYRLGPGESREYTLNAADAPKGQYTLEVYFPAEAEKPAFTQSVDLK